MWQKEIPVSNDWATCHLGTHCGEICPPASEVQSLGSRYPQARAQHTCWRGCEKCLSCWHVIWAAFISPARSSSCWGQQLALHGFGERGLWVWLLTWTAKSSFSLLRFFLFVVLFVFNVFECILSSSWETIPPKWLSLALAGKSLLNSLKQ